MNSNQDLSNEKLRNDKKYVYIQEIGGIESIAPNNDEILKEFEVKFNKEE